MSRAMAFLGSYMPQTFTGERSPISPTLSRTSSRPQDDEEPTIKCSDCSRSVPLSEMVDHFCSSGARGRGVRESVAAFNFGRNMRDRAPPMPSDAVERVNGLEKQMSLRGLRAPPTQLTIDTHSRPRNGSMISPSARTPVSGGSLSPARPIYRQPDEPVYRARTDSNQRQLADRPARSRHNERAFPSLPSNGSIDSNLSRSYSQSSRSTAPTSVETSPQDYEGQKRFQPSLPKPQQRARKDSTDSAILNYLSPTALQDSPSQSSIYDGYAKRNDAPMSPVVEEDSRNPSARGDWSGLNKAFDRMNMVVNTSSAALSQKLPPLPSWRSAPTGLDRAAGTAARLQPNRPAESRQQETRQPARQQRQPVYSPTESAYGSEPYSAISRDGRMRRSPATSKGLDDLLEQFNANSPDEEEFDVFTGSRATENRQRERMEAVPTREMSIKSSSRSRSPMPTMARSVSPLPPLSIPRSNTSLAPSPVEFTRLSPVKSSLPLFCAACDCDLVEPSRANPSGRNVAIHRSGASFCSDCYADRYLPRCRHCDLPINGQAVGSVDGKIKGKYHKHCFGCSVCNEPFPDRDFYVYDEKPVCKLHYHSLSDSLCVTCGEGIEGACVSLGEGENSRGGRYHPDHFCCSQPSCRVQLTEWHYTLDGLPFCEKHALAREAAKQAKYAQQSGYSRQAPTSRAQKRRTVIRRM
ncbi:uncharacterized protein L969DRAFT_82530 [Mixia osmundae IAM 14324]|uniref:LIM zinc-binding domain-containing protein n=1 Tax=Mixia osmundae (strain CBS 9802 / IAM 14324 / JCM 22182 / KY 12970) TaxID=764103 RepID=G7E6W5_MIXOS|nr:uncharacterized protein L969DRAFT_82530 [Mixia osmundae IAM 14324]KEI39043.1 hypothetical protein L969DRAFT_82530 [Mixia osmundae IAM 14324]GAA98575.1 hypothetical protein E5Q_05262 [Mixia osmundae IAM 14324]